MPHSDPDLTSDQMAPQVNGDVASSAFLSHLFSYPVISDSVNTFKSNPYGAKSLEVSNTAYERLGKPFLPYLSKPYEYVSPYVKKADSVADSTLSTLDSKFPVVKKPTGELYDNGKSFVFFPVNKGKEGKDYVFSIYGGEVKKVGGDSLVTYGKAAISTSLIVTSNVVGWLGNYIGQKKEQTKEVANEKLNN